MLIIAKDSLGIASLKVPPLISKTSILFFSFSNNLDKTIIAFPLPFDISSPECPPKKPPTFILKVFANFLFCLLTLIDKVTPAPPLLPDIISLSLLLSILIALFPIIQSFDKLLTPLKSSSSTVVNIAVIGGCEISLSSRIDIIIATPMPLSAPRVVFPPVLSSFSLI